MQDGPQFFIVDKKEFDGYKKIIETQKVSDYEVLTDGGFVDIENLHTTIPYNVYELRTKSEKTLKCADKHIVFNHLMEEVFVVNLMPGDLIYIEGEDGAAILDEVVEVKDLECEEEMYDLELSESSNRRYYTNGILSHNTHLAKVLSKYLFDSEESFIRFDMSEYMEKFDITKLIGAPPGYVGHEDKGQLTERVKNKPYCILLFDEIEKAHKDIFNILLQVLDDGKLTDSHGKEVNFKNTIIIMTSNIGTEKILSDKKLGFNVSSSTNDSVSDKVMAELKKEFRPELLNRIDEKIVFQPLSEANILKIVDIELSHIVSRIEAKGFKVTIDNSVRKFLAENGYDKDYGARPLKRAITTYIETPVAKYMLAKKPKPGASIKLKFDEKQNLVVVK